MPLSNRGFPVLATENRTRCGPCSYPGSPNHKVRKKPGLIADALHEREGLLAGQRGRGGLLRTDEGRGRLPREVGGTTPRRGARPDRRVHPLVQPRAHQTITRLDESGTIPSKPGNGCMIISKKMSAAPYPVTQISILILHTLLFYEPQNT